MNNRVYRRKDYAYAQVLLHAHIITVTTNTDQKRELNTLESRIWPYINSETTLISISKDTLIPMDKIIMIIKSLAKKKLIEQVI